MPLGAYLVPLFRMGGGCGNGQRLAFAVMRLQRLAFAQQHVTGDRHREAVTAKGTVVHAKFLAIFAINCFISASANALIIENLNIDFLPEKEVVFQPIKNDTSVRQNYTFFR